MNNTILILGSNGMAGDIIKTYLEEKGYNVFSTSRGRNKEDKKNYYLDVVSDIRKIEDILEITKPSIVINCIGVLNSFAENNKLAAIMVNSYLPHYIDSLSSKYNFKLIHISTDCVFSGEKGSYTETDLPDATSFYGRSKALGEINNDKNLTFRTSIIGPDTNENGIGLFNWFMKQENEVGGYSKVIWSGVTTLELAKSIEKSFEYDINGLYHLVNNESINKYELLKLFKKSMEKDINIIENSSVVNDKSIINNRTDYKFPIPSYEIMVEEMADWIFDHENKYKCINLVNKKGGSK